MRKKYDVVIVGGGIVGASLALLLASVCKRIAIIEALPALEQKAPSPNPSRTIVLSHSSRVIFEMLGVWGYLAEYAGHINQIHVSDQGYFGGSRIFAKDEQLPALGYVIPAETISTVINSVIHENPAIEVMQPAKFVSFSYRNEQAHIEIATENNNESLLAGLLVAADGHFSAVRQFLGIQADIIDYQQTALLGHVVLKRAHENIAYERFTNQGPLAFLPLPDQSAALVWTVNQERAKTLLALSREDFRSQLQRSFGYRLGKFLHCSELTSVDLQLITASQQITPGMVLVGNAVHTLHPVGGQGLNLALRDVAVLAEIIQFAEKSGQQLGAMKTLESYMTRRQVDQQQTIHLTHALVGLFSNSLLPVVLARNMGMMLLDRVQWLKKILTRRALGFAGKVPRLACGLSLE